MYGLGFLQNSEEVPLQGDVQTEVLVGEWRGMHLSVERGFWWLVSLLSHRKSLGSIANQRFSRGQLPFETGHPLRTSSYLLLFPPLTLHPSLRTLTPSPLCLSPLHSHMWLGKSRFDWGSCWLMQLRDQPPSVHPSDFIELFLYIHRAWYFALEMLSKRKSHFSYILP